MGSLGGRMHYYYCGDISGALVGVDSGTILASCSSVAEFPIHQCTQDHLLTTTQCVFMCPLAQCTSVFMNLPTSYPQCVLVPPASYTGAFLYAPWSIY